ncbi:MAG: hypothetical protein AVDCRST_MAG83-2095 [uncultured Arthrobacter sp.]|uniref:Uncharacterized protein n=1 Tax=uncultured Arthrobacter sp. TaxID=114050 RepID=A0A6J4I5M5_9MICC|nr:MAG: hypothetical protein AVDCRST_MAG83-2095 [uncultured Arthrobacter sp.]
MRADVSLHEGTPVIVMAMNPRGQVTAEVSKTRSTPVELTS